MMTTPLRRLLAVTTFTCILIGPMSRWVDARAIETESTVLTASIPADALTHLDLTALDGAVDLTASTDPGATHITVSVSLAPPRTRNMRRPIAADISQVRIRQNTHQKVLQLGLTNADEGNIEATWTIVVPARFSARINGHDGEIHVTGLSGGVDADLNSGLGGHRGKMSVDVPEGKLKLTVGVGEIVASRASGRFDRADVKASVGSATLYVLGHEIKAPHAPGPGHHISLGGEGDHAIIAKVAVGDVTVRIG